MCFGIVCFSLLKTPLFLLILFAIWSICDSHVKSSSMYIPKYKIFFTLSICLLFNFNKGNCSFCRIRCLFLNIMYFVLSGLIESLFIQNQLKILSSSKFMVLLSKMLLFLQKLQDIVEKQIDNINVESSAKQMTLKRFETLFKSFI